MNDRPEADARIRALLAELGSGPHGESMPAEVAARLDDTLARLVAEREGETSSGNVVPLRRRWATRATAAAAAIVVLGAGGVAAANLGVFGNGPASNSSAGSSSETQGKIADSSPEATSPSALVPKGLRGTGATGAMAVPRVRSDSFAADVSTLLGPHGALATPRDAAGKQSDQGQDAAEGRSSAEPSPARTLRSLGCGGPKITDGARADAVRYDGRLAVLVVHPERNGGRLVEAWNCAGNRRLTGTTLTP